MSESTALAKVVKQSAFAKENASMAHLFAKRLQDLFSPQMGSITVKSFGTEEESWSKSITEKIEFSLPDGVRVNCHITTPKKESSYV